MTTMHTMRAEGYVKDAAVRRYECLLTIARDALAQAVGLPHIGALKKAQARAGLAVLRKELSQELPALPSRAEVGGEKVDDLRRMCGPIDAFILEIGKDANASVPGVMDLTQFEDQLKDALEGNGIYELTKAARGLD